MTAVNGACVSYTAKVLFFSLCMCGECVASVRCIELRENDMNRRKTQEKETIEKMLCACVREKKQAQGEYDGRDISTTKMK